MEQLYLASALCNPQGKRRGKGASSQPADAPLASLEPHLSSKVVSNVLGLRSSSFPMLSILASPPRGRDDDVRTLLLGAGAFRFGFVSKAAKRGAMLRQNTCFDVIDQPIEHRLNCVSSYQNSKSSLCSAI